MDDNKVLNINSESVENSLDSIDKAKSFIQTSIDDIDYAKRHLDIEIDKGSYALIRENLKSIYEDLNVCLNNNVNIKIQCENFIHDTDTTEGQVVSITDQSDLDRINALTDDPSFDSNASFDSRAVAEACGITDDDVLLLGRGPVPLDSLTREDIALIQGKKTREENRKLLIQSGVTPEDADRVLNREISPEDLFKEIFEEYCSGNNERYEILIQAAMLNQNYFCRSESELLLSQKEERLSFLLSDESLEEKSRLEQEFIIYNNAVQESRLEGDIYVYTSEDGTSVTFTQDEYASLVQTRDYLGEKLDDFDSSRQAEIEQLQTEIGNLNALLSDSSKRDFTYHSMDELDGRLSEINSRIAEIDARLASLSNAGYPKKDGLYVIENPPVIEVQQQPGATDLIESELLNGVRELNQDVISYSGNITSKIEIIATDGTGNNIYVTKKNGDELHITIVVEGNSYYEIIEEKVNGKWSYKKVKLPNQKVTYTFTDESGRIDSFTTFSGSQSSYQYFNEYLRSRGMDPAFAFGHNELYLPDGSSLTITVTTSDGNPMQVPEREYWDLPINDGRYSRIQNNYNAALEYNELLLEKRELVSERDECLRIKNNVLSDVDNYIKYSKYFLQEDFNDDCVFDINEAREISKLPNRWGFMPNTDFYDICRSMNRSPDDVKGALLARVVNGDAIIIPHQQDDRLFVHGTNSGMEYGFTGCDSLGDYYIWINAGVLSDYEKHLFNYICKVEGYGAGFRYLRGLSSELDKRYIYGVNVDGAKVTGKFEEDQQFARSSTWAGVLSLLVEPIIALANTGQIMRRKRQGSDIFLSTAYNPGTVWHTTIASDIGKQNGKGWEMAYNIMYSLNQSMMNLLLAYATGGTSVSAVFSSTLIMGLPVFNASFYDAKSKGIDDDTALLLSGLKATTEIAMESFSLTHLLGLEASYQRALSSGTIVSTFADRISRLPAKLQPVAQNLLVTGYCMISQGLIGGEEEFATEILDNLWDFALAKEDSLAYTKYSEYKKLHPGCSDFEAGSFAISQVVNAGWDDFIAGFIAESIMGGATHASSSTGIDLATYSDVAATRYGPTEANRNITPEMIELLINSFNGSNNLNQSQRRELAIKLIEYFKNPNGGKITGIGIDINGEINILTEELVAKNEARGTFVTELQEMDGNLLASIYADYISSNNIDLTEDMQSEILRICELYQQLSLEFESTYGMSIESYLANSGNIITEQDRATFGSEALYVYQLSKAFEPQVTALLHTLEGNGARLVGLEHNLKTIDSITRKLAKNGYTGDPLMSINDSLRYTMILDADTYTEDLVSKLYILVNNGYQISYINNHWDKPGYRGLNVGLIVPDSGGLVMEIQFHTETSFAAKENFNHVLYELARNSSMPQSIREMAGELMSLNQDVVNPNVPENATSINLYTINNMLDTRRYTDYDEFNNEYGAEAKAWCDALPADVRRHFDIYTGEDQNKVANYHPLNRILRGSFWSKDRTRVFPTHWEYAGIELGTFETLVGMTAEEFANRNIEAAKAMVLAAQGFRIKQNTVIYRGADINVLSEYGITGTETAEEIYAKLTADGSYIYTDGGFMSSSPVPSGITKYRAVLFEINTQKGTAFIDLSAINPCEREILFLPGQRFHIDGVYISDANTPGQIVIKMTSLVETIDVDSIGAENSITTSTTDTTDAVHMFDESTDSFADYEASGFSTIKIDAESTQLYKDAPSFATQAELFEYGKATISEPDGVPKVAMAFLKFINQEAGSSSLGSSLYYSFMNLSECGLEVEDKVKVMNFLINGSKSLRESVVEGARGEISDVLNNNFGLSDPKLVDEILNSILGPEFVENGITTEHDWNDFASIMGKIMDLTVQESVASGKEPVLWSGFGDEYHDAMDKVFTTISNTSIAQMYFIESVFTNWSMDGQTYKTSELWGKLSELYAQKLGIVFDPNTGTHYDTVKFLYPTGVSPTDSFGELFKTVELPQIVKDGTIKTITLTEVDPNTMTIIGTIDIDLTDIISYYAFASTIGTEHDAGINQDVFNLFLDKVKEETK